MTNLWSYNTPERFWLCQPEIPNDQWDQAIQKAVSILELPTPPEDTDALLEAVLGEGQFGSSHWRLSPAKRLYYQLKPLMPRALRLALRRIYIKPSESGFLLDWPIEDRYARFQWEVMRQVMVAADRDTLSFTHFWPDGHQCAFIITHDIETADGQAHARAIADLDASFGFRSSFYFVPECYPIDHDLMKELNDRGFEIGVHGLNHDGKLFSSHTEFKRRAVLINQYLKAFGAVGFRSPLTHRHPEWMQDLEVDYDLSCFDTDPYEPMPGGVMSIWPFHIGRFVEMPYTLAQDSTLTMVLGHTSPQLWLDKVNFIEQYYGMVLINVHPDYLRTPENWEIYAEFLRTMQEKGKCWHALPREVARWWRTRGGDLEQDESYNMVQGKITLTDNGIKID